MKVQPPFWGVVGLILIFFLLAYGIPKFFIPPDPTQTIRVFTRILALLLGVVLYSFVTARFALSGLDFERTARTHQQQAGQLFEERFWLTNRWRISRLWIEIRDDSDLPGFHGSRILSKIGPKESRTYTAYTLVGMRGKYHLGPTRLISGDVFGLFSVEKSFSADDELLVLPKTVPLDYFAMPQGFFPGGRAILQKATEVTPQAAGVREYIPGDGLRSIHWPTTARKNRLMVKEYEQDPQADVWIMLDANRSTHILMKRKTSNIQIRALWQLWDKQIESDELPRDTFEYAVSSAASIASYYLKRGRAVGFTCTSQAVSFFQPERGDRQLRKIIEELAHLTCTGKVSLAQNVEMHARYFARASTIVLVTAEFDSALDLAISHLLLRNLRPVVIQIDASTFLDDQGFATAGGSPSAFGSLSKPIRISYAGDLKRMLESGTIRSGM